MEKNFDGYYSLFTIWTGDMSSGYDKGISIKVENNKITDCFKEGPDSTLSNLDDHFHEVVGENFKDFVVECVANNRFFDIDFDSEERTFDGGSQDLLFKKISESDFLKLKQYEFATEEEMKAHDQRVAAILQSKENKATLGKTGVMDKIAAMKSGHEGGK